MRIAIDATSLLLRSAGVKNYVYYWMRSLQREAAGHSVTAFPVLGDAGDLNHEASVLPLWQTLPRIALLHFMNIRGNPGMDLLLSGVDVFHASNQVRNPPRRPMLTGTLYDMTCLLMPQNHTAANVQAERNFADKVLKRARGLIAISENTKRDAVQLLNVNPDLITVIYPGVAAAFFNVRAEKVAEVRERYRLLKPFALFVGTIEPRKNIDTLLDAWQQLPAGVRSEHELVIAGPIGWAGGSTVARLRSGVPGLRVIGYVPEPDLAPLTAAAAVFVYPSLYEGFGFPVAQAMAAGVPVITSNVSSLPEVAGGAAVLVDPKSVAALRDALNRLLSSKTLQMELAANGRMQAKAYTWEEAARRSVEFFNRLR